MSAQREPLARAVTVVAVASLVLLGAAWGGSRLLRESPPPPSEPFPIRADQSTSFTDDQELVKSAGIQAVRIPELSPSSTPPRAPVVPGLLRLGTDSGSDTRFAVREFSGSATTFGAITFRYETHEPTEEEFREQQKVADRPLTEEVRLKLQERLAGLEKILATHHAAFDPARATAEELQAHEQGNQAINQVITMVLERLNR